MKKFWNFAFGPEETNLDLFGPMGSDYLEGFSEKDFLAEFRQIPNNQALKITINSPGGSVQTGLSIYELLKTHNGPITIHVAGWAFSAATLVTSVPNAKVVVSVGSVLMIHQISGFASGTKEEMAKTAGLLEKLENQVAEIYAAKTGKSVEEIKQAMKEETYFNAKEAVAFGLADEIDEEHEVTNIMEGSTLLVNGLKVAPEFIAGVPTAFLNAEGKPSAEKSKTREVHLMDLEQLKAEYPQLVEEIRAQALKEGAEQERARIQSIEAVALPGFENLIAGAKFDGVTTAEQLSIQIVKAQMEKRSQVKKDLAEDAKALENVKPSMKAELESESDKLQAEAFIKAAHSAFSAKTTGGK